MIMGKRESLSVVAKDFGLDENVISVIAHVVQETQSTDPKELLLPVCDALMELYDDDSLEDELATLHLQTTDDVMWAIRQYFDYQSAVNEALAAAKIRKTGKRAKRPPQESECSSDLTEGAMALIEKVVKETNLRDPYALLPHVCNELMQRYQYNFLEYHLRQMHLQTTEEIIRSITCFFISKTIFPTKSYLGKL